MPPRHLRRRRIDANAKGAASLPSSSRLTAAAQANIVTPASWSSQLAAVYAYRRTVQIFNHQLTHREKACPNALSSPSPKPGPIMAISARRIRRHGSSSTCRPISAAPRDLRDPTSVHVKQPERRAAGNPNARAGRGLPPFRSASANTKIGRITWTAEAKQISDR
jgi:hypothetical protein